MAIGIRCDWVLSSDHGRDGVMFAIGKFLGGSGRESVIESEKKRDNEKRNIN